MDIVLFAIGYVGGSLIGLAIGVWIVTRPRFVRWAMGGSDMGTVPIPPKPDTEPSALENGVRSAIAGHPRGAVRRIVLWTIVIAAIGVALVLTTSPAESIALVIALAAIALLSLTDQLA